MRDHLDHSLGFQGATAAIDRSSGETEVPTIDDSFFAEPRMVRVEAYVDERVLKALRAHGVDVGRCVRDALQERVREVADSPRR